MPIFNLSNEPCSFREHAYFEVQATKFFPEEQDSREQLMLLLYHELNKGKLEGAEEYEPSSLIKLLAPALKKRLGQMHTAGLVALVMCSKNGAGERMSLNASAPVVAKYAEVHPKVLFGALIEGDEGHTATISSDVATVERHFRRWRSVAHLLAADICIMDYMDPAVFPDRNISFEYSYFKTAAFFQSVLKKADSYKNWGLHELDGSPPDFFEHATICFPSRAMVSALFTPYLLELDRGASDQGLGQALRARD